MAFIDKIINENDLIDTSLFINWNDDERQDLFNNINKKYKIKELAKILQHDETTLYQIRIGQVKPSTRLYFSFLDISGKKVQLSSLKISSRNAEPISIINKELSAELIGLIHSDGHINLIKSGKGVIFYFCNKRKELIDRFCKLILESFYCKIKIKKDKRDNTYYAYPPSAVARIIAKKIGWKTKDYINLDFSEKDISDYFTGLFDGDGSIYIYHNSRIIIPTIKITTDSLYHAENIKYLLNKVNIYGRISQEKRKNHKWCNVIITRQKDFLRFIEMIDSKHIIKKERINDYLKNKDKLFEI